MTEPTFPPQMWGHAVTGTGDPFDVACGKASLGCDAGLVAYNLGTDRMSAALVLAPEVPLARAMAMLPLAAVGLQNALGALAPPEVAVHLDWTGPIRINGAKCGAFRVAAATTDPDTVPDWLTVGFDLPLLPASDDPGETPDQTFLFMEGCADITPVQIVESWARHTLNWIARWEDSGNAPLHAEWRGLAHGIGEETTLFGQTGTFLGIDEDFAMLLRAGDTTNLISLTRLLE